MRDYGIRRWLAGAAFAGLALAGSHAGAVVYVSTFDPPNFTGTATFDVSQGCIDSGPGTVGNNVGNCVVTWLTASITFQDAPGLTFGYSHLLPDSGIVNNVFIQGGDLAGVNSGLLGPRVISGQSNPDFNGPWWIQFEFFPPPPDFLRSINGAPSLGIVNLFGGSCEGIELVCTPDLNNPSIAIVQTFRLIPEPGSLGLLLAALAGAWSARRRVRA